MTSFASKIVLLATLLSATAHVALAYQFVGTVVAVHDGDTLTVRDSHRRYAIRLKGIDAPELAQRYGTDSRDRLRSRVLGKRVVVSWNKHDKYNRRVGKVTLNGRDLNLEQVRDGLAWHYKLFIREQTKRDRAAYAAAERQARKGRVGVWHPKRQLAPWTFREQVRQSDRTKADSRDLR